MCALPNSILARMTQDQQIVYSAMMMNPKMIPNFHEKEIECSHEIGVQMKKLFDTKVFTKMYLDDEGKVNVV
jgi:hypothetical protein